MGAGQGRSLAGMELSREDLAGRVTILVVAVRGHDHILNDWLQSAACQLFFIIINLISRT